MGKGRSGCISRRGFIKAGAGVAAVLFAGGLEANALANTSGDFIYPQVRIANLRDLRPGRVIRFDYPLVGRKNLLMDLGCTVDGGAGPNRSIVAYSMFCTHLGCGVDLDRHKGVLICECHQSIYDPKQSGRVIEGPAPTNLPKIFLEIDGSTGDIYAVGVAGLIYGLRNNLLDGKEVR